MASHYPPTYPPSYPPAYPPAPEGWHGQGQASGGGIDGRALVAFLLLPLIVLLDSIIWFGLSSLLYTYVAEHMGLAIADYGKLRAWMVIAATVGILVGGVVAIGLGPRVTMAAGLGICTLGMALLAVGPAQTALASVIVVSAGQGIYRPTTYAAAADALPWPRPHLRNTLCVVIYMTVNLGAALSSFLAYRFLDFVGPAMTFVALAAGLVFATLLAVGLAVAHRMLRPRETVPSAEIQTTRRLDPVFLGLGLGLVVLTALPWLSYSLNWELQYEAANAVAPRLMETSYFFSINPALVVVFGAVLVVGLLVAHFTRTRIPTLLPAGLGLVALGLGMVGVLGSFHVGGAAVLVVAMVVLAGGEVLAAPLLASRIAGDQHTRVVTLVTALGMSSIYAGGIAIDWIGSSSPQASHFLGWGLGGICVVVGLIVAGAAIPLRKVITPRQDPPPGTPLPY